MGTYGVSHNPKRNFYRLPEALHATQPDESISTPPSPVKFKIFSNVALWTAACLTVNILPCENHPKF